MHTFSRSRYEINLDSLSFNIENFKALVKPSLISVAVKADAYGHGMLEVSKRLDKIGVEFLCVSSADEALFLRTNGIDTKILILSEPPAYALRELSDQNISLTIYTADLLEHMRKLQSRFDVHLKINTGMNRVGIRPEKARALLVEINKTTNVNLEGIYTHFGSADDPVREESILQLKSFEHFIEEISDIAKPKYIHAANTAATLTMEESRFNMVRIGLGAYGHYPSPEMESIVELKPLGRLVSEITFVHRVHAGEKVSYMGRFVAPRDTNIAVIPLGYGDGIFRNLGFKGGQVSINKELFPIVGAVTMDQLLVDIGDNCFETGEEVILMGGIDARITAEDIAMKMDTISYEVLCSISPRVKRIYE